MADAYYDLVIVGGGIGGYTAAIHAARRGLRPLLVEADKVGGVCLHRGCIPTKALLQGAAELAAAARWGLSWPLDAWARLQEAKRQAVAAAYRDLLRLLQKHGIEVAKARARLAGPHCLVLDDGRQVEGRWIILATGSRPRMLPALPPDGQRVLDSDQALALTSPPRHLLVIGGGAVGLELASLFLDLGTEVTVVEVMPRLLPQEDEEVSWALRRALERRGARILTGASLLEESTCVGEEGVKLMVEVEGERMPLQAQQALVAVGRVGNVETLGLESAGVKVEGGFVAVDGHGHTGVGGLYAVGDVAGGPLLAHKAAQEAATAVAALAGENPPPLARHQVPRVVYCRPQVAAVGLTTQEAAARGLRVRTRRLSFRTNAMAALRGEGEGFVKLVYEADTGQVLGVHIVGPQAEELIAEAALALKAGLRLEEWAQVVHPHPSLSETVGEAVRMAHGSSIYL